MGHVSTNRNEPIDIHLRDDYRDNGWSVSQGRAIHDSCNNGFIRNRNLVPIPGQSYKITYTVSDYQSGQVYPVVGGVNGPAVTANGTYTAEITAADNSLLMFWSDGNLAVSSLKVSIGTVEGDTIAFRENDVIYSHHTSFVPEMMAKFIDGFYSFRNGVLWEHNVNDIRNSFYGEQYPSIITFYINIEPRTVKNLRSIRINGNKPWAITDVFVYPREGKSRGQRSRIKAGNFKNYQGQWYADFLRDMNDSRFSTELQALMKGAELQGQVARITMEINSTEEVRLVSVETWGDLQQYTY